MSDMIQADDRTRIAELERAIEEIRIAWKWYHSCGGCVSHDDIRAAVMLTDKAIEGVLQDGPTE